MAIGIDVGGTFTDVVRVEGDSLTVVKVSTTPDQSAGVVAGATAAGADGSGLLVHGTTAATNALLERRGARLALVTDAGLLDVIEIGRSERPSLYDSWADRPEPLVPRDARLAADADDLVARLSTIGPDVVVVALKGSYADPTGEIAVHDAIREGLEGVDVVLSHRVANEFREYERTSTAVVAGFLRPSVDRYLSRLRARAVPGLVTGVLVMQSSGGVTSIPEAAANPTSILLSGPAGGVAAAGELAERLGLDRAVSFDMGGTSTDVCRIEGGRPVVRGATEIEGYPCLVPTVAIHTVGAGGGSIAWIDPGGSLRVGPRSAGADPGPAGYGRGGTEPTVTDANIVLGRIAPDAVFGDGVAIDHAASRRAVSDIASRLDMSVDEAAAGIIEVVEAHMERAINEVSVREGHDLRQAALVAFGGAGGLHAASLAVRLGMRRTVVPRHAGVFSAVGLLTGSLRSDVVVSSPDLSLRRLEDLVTRARALAAERFRAATGRSPDLIEMHGDLRYVGQSHETRVALEDEPTQAGAVAAFHRTHLLRNGFNRPDDPVELVAVRAVAMAPQGHSPGEGADAGPGRTGARRVHDGSGRRDVAVADRAALAPASIMEGPMVVEDRGSTIWVPTGARMTVLATGELEIET